MKTLAQVFFENSKSNLNFEEFREALINSGAFPDVAILDLPANETVEKIKKSTKTPRSVNWAGHETLRESLRNNTPLSEVVRFLIGVVYERLQKVGGEVNLELEQEWKDKVEPHLNDLSSEDAVKVSCEWLNKVLTLGEFGSKSMNAYLNTTNKKGGSKSKEVESDNFFKDDDDKSN
jgi:hypothetical protein